HDRIKPLLVRASQLSQDIETAALTTEIAGFLNAAITAKREKRDATRELIGSILPAASGKKRRKAKQVHEHLPGGVESPVQAPRRGFSLSWFHDEGRD